MFRPAQKRESSRWRFWSCCVGTTGCGMSDPFSPIKSTMIDTGGWWKGWWSDRRRRDGPIRPGCFFFRQRWIMIRGRYRTHSLLTPRSLWVRFRPTMISGLRAYSRMGGGRSGLFLDQGPGPEGRRTEPTTGAEDSVAENTQGGHHWRSLSVWPPWVGRVPCA